MSWSYDTSLNRVQKHLDDMGEIEVEKLVRDADLNSLLSETKCRDIFGAHVYVDVPNFSDLATLTAEGDDYRRVIQAVHLYEREVARIVEGADVFDGVRIHFQGTKLHALFFRPIDDAEEIATRAVLLQMVLRHFVCCRSEKETAASSAQRLQRTGNTLGWMADIKAVGSTRV
jgi:hypothetical protein